MKKWLLLLILSVNTYPYSFNEIEDAILEVNVEKVEEILKDMGSLTNSQKVAYINLTQHIIDRLSTDAYIKQIKGHSESGLLVLGVCGFVISSIMTIGYFTIGDYDYHRDGIKPIGIATAILSIFYAACAQGSIYEKEANSLKRKKLTDALYIQQRIYLL